ncbi:androgen-dependent TFPI-regulating protein [Rhynchocyon petersi]
MTKTATCTYHFLIMSWYIYLNYYISKSAEDPRKAKIFQNGGQWKYLTFLNLLLQSIFFGVACLDDVLKRITRKKDIKIITACRDLLFTSMAFPMSMVVFLLFWAIFLYDRELVYPKTLDGLFPGWLNHAMEERRARLWLHLQAVRGAGGLASQKRFLAEGLELR